MTKYIKQAEAVEILKAGGSMAVSLIGNRGIFSIRDVTGRSVGQVRANVYDYLTRRVRFVEKEAIGRYRYVWKDNA